MAYKGTITVNRNPESHDNIPEKLTKEQEEFRDAVYDRCLAELTSSQDVDEPVLEEELAWLYAWDNMPPPDVLVLDSPLAVVKEARKYDPKIQSTQWIGLSWDAPRAAFYEAHRGMTDKKGKSLLYHEVMEHVLRMSKAGAWDGVLFDGDKPTETGLVIVSRRPTVLRHDEQFRPHCTTGPCAAWKDGYSLYAYHGVELEERHIMAPESFTREELLAERNSERVRAIAEILGWDRFLEKIGTKLVDSAVVETRNAEGVMEKLRYELHAMDSKDHRWERAPRFLKMQSPELRRDYLGPDGKPMGPVFYMEPVHPELKTALAARKWQIPTEIYPTTEWPSPEECNRDSSLDFLEEA